MNPKSNGFQFDAGSHIYCLDGRKVPSVTQVLRAVGIAPDYSRVEPGILERKRLIGVALHKCLHYLQECDLDPDTVDPEVQPYLVAHKLFVKDRGFKVLTIETPRVATLNGLPHGMTPDVTGLMKGEPYLIDWKTTEGKPEPAWGVQLAAYEHGLPKPLIPPFHYRRASLQLLSSGKYHFEEWENPQDIERFKGALFETWCRINEGAEPWKENGGTR